MRTALEIDATTSRNARNRCDYPKDDFEPLRKKARNAPDSQNMFDIYGLALPWGLNFVDSMPIAGWKTVDAASWGIVTFNEEEKTYGCIAMRQRVDFV